MHRPILVSDPRTLCGRRLKVGGFNEDLKSAYNDIDFCPIEIFIRRMPSCITMNRPLEAMTHLERELFFPCIDPAYNPNLSPSWLNPSIWICPI